MDGFIELLTDLTNEAGLVDLTNEYMHQYSPRDYVNETINGCINGCMHKRAGPWLTSPTKLKKTNPCSCVLG